MKSVPPHRRIGVRRSAGEEATGLSPDKRLLTVAAAVVAKASRERPADAVLRDALKNAKGLSRGDSKAISGIVFAYYRWLGWMDRNKPVEQRLGEASKLDGQFQKKPSSFSDSDLQHAVPSWVRDSMDVSTDWLRSLQSAPNLWLRARKGQGMELAMELGDCRPAAPGALQDALHYDGERDLFRMPEFHAGEFELQDITSQIVGHICNPQAGETWWDACAGEGGKLLHLSDLMGNKGLIWASDRTAWRLQKLKRRAARAGVFNYRAALWDGGAKLPTKTKFDGILVDAPCSGIGTWQRNPHARWTTTLEDVKELGEVQIRLLSHAVTALKPGGRLLYSVCTLAQAETSGVAAAVGKGFPELEPLDLLNPLEPTRKPARELWLWPQEVHGNGMFICGWRMPPRSQGSEKTRAV